MIEFYSAKHSYYDEYKSCCVHNCVRQILEYYGFEDASLLINSNYSFNVKIELNEREIIIGREVKISQEQLSQLYYPLYSINRKRKLFKFQLSILLIKGIDTNGLCDDFDEVLKKWEYILLLLLKMKYIEENYRSCQKIVAYIEQIYFMEVMQRWMPAFNCQVLRIIFL